VTISETQQQYLLFRFLAKHRIPGIAIRWDTDSLFEHVELGVLNDPTDWKSASGWLGAHASGGVKIRALNYCNPSRDYRYAVPVGPSEYAACMNFGMTKVGTSYDLLDILGLAARIRRLHSPSREICSEFAYQVTEAGNLKALNVEPSFSYLITPDLFHASPLFRGCRVLAKGEPK
jgi:hypothetical protein